MKKPKAPKLTASEAAWSTYREKKKKYDAEQKKRNDRKKLRGY